VEYVFVRITKQPSEEKKNSLKKEKRKRFLINLIFDDAHKLKRFFNVSDFERTAHFLGPFFSLGLRKNVFQGNFSLILF